MYINNTSKKKVLIHPLKNMKMSNVILTMNSSN